MAPVRRYLRISKYSVLECRIYLDNPSLVQSWLLNPRNPILPRVIESVRPWVLPKLREEQERAARKKTSSKAKSIKDTVITDDFEVSIFLTETNTRHSILAKHKHFHDKAPRRIQSNANKLTGETDDHPVDVDASVSATATTAIRQESDGEDDIRLANIPETTAGRGAKRRRNSASAAAAGDDDASAVDLAAASDTDTGSSSPPPKRRRDRGRADAPPGRGEGDDNDDDDDEKKNMAMDVSYEGFAIYGRVLCLVVRRRDGGRGSTGQRTAGGGGRAAAARSNAGQASMENWIASTQMPVGEAVP
ncbi:hypothetical protein GMORB2_3913 [Geosmithia morbida]|uniref:Uncharacterized protein n=1 Tax=Geosmithia morbida TaxID=1094350 RepID=A0A9P5D818_9HYPO|nr:uncharacterized protein GMORB2_3913 [Geosmithia morbida]KAF4125074.1 hypothetical protein GMORB2_3913 [Geosmithia morbida]